MKLLTTSNAKTKKGEELGWMTAILHLAPGDISGFEVCGQRDSCFDSCLYSSGRGGLTTVQEARIRKTKLFFKNRVEFMSQLVVDIAEAMRVAHRNQLALCVRLNGTSDIPWESIKVGRFDNIMDVYPHVQFYDYTKLPNRKRRPENYHLTFSRGSDNDLNVRRAMNNGMNIAVVFDQLPTHYQGRRVIDGTEHDLRFLDPAGVIVGLLPKGSAKHDQTNFVLRKAA